MWGPPDFVALSYGHNGASLASPRVLVFAGPVFALINDLIEGGDDVPWAAINGHGDVLGERFGEDDGRREVAGPDLDGWWLGRVIGVGPETRVQAAGGFVPAPDA